MPGRRGKQRVKRKKSKRQKPSEMERVLVDSIHGRRRKEREILKDKIPPPVKPRTNKVCLTSTLPMFNPLPVINNEVVMEAIAPASTSTSIIKKKLRSNKAKKVSSC